MGWIADKSHTRRLPLLVGLLVLGGATVMLCVGRSIPVLLVGRLLQGLSAAVVWTTGLALLVDTVGQREVGKAMGMISIAYSSAAVIGPLLGGVVYARSGYYAVFYMAFGLIGLDVALRLTFIEKKVAARWTSGEAVPISLERAGESELQDRTSSRQPGIDAQGLEEAVRRTPRHIAPIFTLVKSRRILAAFWGCLVLAALFTAFDSTLPLYANQIFGFSSFGSGLLFLSLLVPNLCGPLVGRLCDKYGPRWLAASGLLLALPFWVLLRLVTTKSTGQIVLLCALLVFIGICTALSLSPLMAEFTYIVEAKEKHRPGLFGASGAYAQAYGLFNTAWAAGSVVGPLWAGFVRARAGWGTMTLSLGLLSAVSALPVLICTGGLISRKR